MPDASSHSTTQRGMRPACSCLRRGGRVIHLSLNLAVKSKSSLAGKSHKSFVRNMGVLFISFLVAPLAGALAVTLLKFAGEVLTAGVTHIEGDAGDGSAWLAAQTPGGEFQTPAAECLQGRCVNQIAAVA